MPRKTSRGAGLTVSQTAAQTGASAAAIRNWIKGEKTLAKLVKKEAGMTLFPPAAVKEVTRIYERSRSAASPALRAAWDKRRAGAVQAKSAAPGTPVTAAATGKTAVKAKAVKAKAKAKAEKSATGAKSYPGLERAWAARRANAAARRATVGAVPKTRTKTKGKAKTKPSTQPAASGGLTGEEAARKLGINKVRLYDIMKRFGIKKPGGQRAFTDDVVARIEAALESGRGAAKKATRVARKQAATMSKRSSVAAAQAGDAFSHAMHAVRQAVEVRLEEYRAKVKEILEQQQKLIDKAMEEVGLK